MNSYEYQFGNSSIVAFFIKVSGMKFYSIPPELLTNAIFRLSGDHEGTFIVP